jgi:ADP-L-glycero-D-manno-heptose 6-epimerase
MIVVTGAAGFIGSCMVGKLNSEGHTDIILVDDFNKSEKDNNLKNKKYLKKIDRTEFLKLLSPNDKNDVEFFVHIGARTDTTETNVEIFNELNLNYSKSIWNYCVKNKIPLIYISSAATYGNGEYGYDDNISLSKLKPLNLYGESKNNFDKWVLTQTETPPNWYGLKYFNVFGPNEYHKSRMASVVFHAYNQIIETKQVKLFSSNNDDYDDGEQLRDFIYVKDVIDVMYFLLKNKPTSGIYNLGTGKARTFISLVTAVFKALNKNTVIQFIDIPDDIKYKYQYFTEAKMDKLRSIGYTKPFYTLESAIDDYIKNYLSKNLYL